jgi:hypothetical protein
VPSKTSADGSGTVSVPVVENVSSMTEADDVPEFRVKADKSFVTSRLSIPAKVAESIAVPGFVAVNVTPFESTSPKLTCPSP